jgi:DNA-binding CsgD family transcriptional regulator
MTKNSPRELQVAKLIAEGLCTGEMATRLGISEKTVAVHRGHICAKLGVSNDVRVAEWHTVKKLHELFVELAETDELNSKELRKLLKEGAEIWK